MKKVTEVIFAIKCLLKYFSEFYLLMAVLFRKRHYLRSPKASEEFARDTHFGEGYFWQQSNSIFMLRAPLSNERWFLQWSFMLEVGMGRKFPLWIVTVKKYFYLQKEDVWCYCILV